MVMNSSMQVIHDATPDSALSAALPPDLADIAEAGFTTQSGRLYLLPWREWPAPAHFGDWEAERWVNEIQLKSERDPADTRWRGDLLGQGLQLARRLLSRSAGFTSLPVQACVSLQSAPDDIDPEADFAVGSVHIYLLREPGDDLTVRIDQFTQPVLVLTTDDVP